MPANNLINVFFLLNSLKKLLSHLKSGQIFHRSSYSHLSIHSDAMFHPNMVM